MTTANNDDDDDNNNIKEHLDWSHKQSRILTANNTAPLLYTPERGYPFHSHELPHYHLLNNTTHTLRRRSTTTTSPRPPPSSSTDSTIIVGAWTRPFFVGQWEHSTSQSEDVFNIQTSRLFIDLRIPTTKPRRRIDGPRRRRRRTSRELRCEARQHVFAGVTILNIEQRRPVATRHHFIDWNYVGVGRSRPNKWFVEMKEEGCKRGDVWKEWSFAKDDYGQCYYWERWERLVGGRGDGVVVAMRKRRGCGRDGIVVVVGDHFNYIHDRVLTGKETKYDAVSSLVDLVDTAVSHGDFETAESYLSMEGGHGRVSSGWIIDTSIHSWKEGTALFTPDSVVVRGGGGGGLVEESCYVLWNGEEWDVWESSLASMEELEMLLKFGKVNNNSRL